MDWIRTLRTVTDDGFLVVLAMVVFVLALASPVVGLSLTESDPSNFQDGTASLTIEQPTTDRLSVTDGRFGTPVVYLRLPDLVATVDAISGQPRIIYEITVPALDVELQQTRVIDSPGTVRVRMSDRAFERLPSGTYDGRLIVRVQSTDGDWTIRDRALEVSVP
jgi:hypothetical protein